MSAYSDLYGGIVTLGSQATLLSSESTPMAEITIRTLPTAARIYFGNSTVTAGGDNAHSFLDGGEEFVWGPYTRGGGIRPAQVFLAGPAGTVVLWSAWPG